MATVDLSRASTEFRKHFTSVRAQMGRVFTDDDHNDNERLHDEDERRSRVHIIGPAGSPDAGFLIKGPTVTNGRMNFDIMPGTFYLGGHRLDLEQMEKFQTQADWVSMGHEDMPLPPGNASRFDLVYLECWQQPVSAVEDSELFEIALGGPDTSVRMRLMRRVRVFAGSQTGDCHQAWANLTAQWATLGLGTLNAHHELVVNTKLTVGFAAGSDKSDLCSPPVAGGYLGAENQAIRVQLVDATHFTWGFDNAAPLYRVTIGPNSHGQLRKVTMLTAPKDQAHWPVAGQVVELLPWSAVLSNQEKVSEVSGFLTRVDASYDPDTRELFLADAVPTDSGHLQPGFLYMRVWNRGSDTTSPVAIPFVNGTPVALGNSGLNVTFSGSDHHPADYWIIAARPASPNRVVPWLLEAGRGPHGIRRYYAPLAVITWTPGGGTGTVVHDCRNTFPPLTRLRSCCTYTVGDGVSSQGHFGSIQAAINALPREEGGEVCVLPGEHWGQVVIDGRQNITIHGCGQRSVLRAAEGNSAALLRITNGSQGITVDNLALVAAEGIAIHLEQVPGGPHLERIILSDLDIRGRDRSTIFGQGGKFVTVCNSRITIVPLVVPLGTGASTAGLEPAIFLAGEDLLIEGNRILAGEDLLSEGNRTLAAATGRFVNMALGGVQIAGDSRRVEIRRNVIEGGNGNGITLGSLSFVPADNASSVEFLTNFFASATVRPFFGNTYRVTDNGCLEIDPHPPSLKGDNDEPLVPISDGDLTHVRIVDNDIARMGTSGISVVRFFVLGEQPDFITVDHLTIENNRIRECMRLELANISPNLHDIAAYGGIVLADGAYVIVRDNVVMDNGTNFHDPICGIFVLHVEGVAIDGNRILGNGRMSDPDNTPRPGQRGGIVIGLARARTPSTLTPLPGFTGARQDGVPAARIHDNIVVSPEGRALKLIAVGPVSVQGNQFTTKGSHALNRTPFPGNAMVGARNFAMAPAAQVAYTNRQATSSPLTAFLDALGGAVVSIVNLGVSNEIYLQLLGFSGLGLVQPSENVDDFDDDLRLFVGGNVLFNDNQVVLDALAPSVTLSLSAVLLLSLDDVSMVGNQCDCDMVFDFVGINALVVGWSVRVTDNRFKEGLLNAFLSAFTAGLWFNTTTDNQGTHCFIDVGLRQPTISITNVQPGNITLRFNTHFLPGDRCTLFDNRKDAIGATFGVLRV
jgi:hypothetical protein